MRPEPHELSFHYTPALPKNPDATPRLSEQVREPEEQSFLTPRKRRNRDRAARDGGGERKPNTSSRRRCTTPCMGVARFRWAFSAAKSSRSRYGEDGKGRRRGTTKSPAFSMLERRALAPVGGQSVTPPGRRAAGPPGIGHWPPITGHQSLATNHWPPITGHRPLAPDPRPRAAGANFPLGTPARNISAHLQR